MAISQQYADRTFLQPVLPRRVLPPVGFNHYIVSGAGGHGRARADALLAVTQVFACRVAVFGYDATRHDKFLIIFGEPPVLDALDLLLPQVERRMESASRTAVDAYANEVHAALPFMGRAQRRSLLTIPYMRAYLRGYGAGAAEAIRAYRSQIIAGDGADLTDVLAVQERRAEEACTREFPDSPLVRMEEPAHGDAFMAGHDAGLAAGLEHEYAAQHDLVFAML